jgi:ketosteroid isomerase-like protein
MTRAFEPLDLPHPADDDRSARAASLRSRAFVQAGDRDGWIGLFAADGVVQDPVGVSFLDETGEGHRGHERIRAFWDDVIAKNPVRMDILSSHAGGDEVANFLTITTTFPDGSSVAGEMVAVYAVDDAGKVRSLRAFWEVDQLRFSPAPS